MQCFGVFIEAAFGRRDFMTKNTVQKSIFALRGKQNPLFLRLQMITIFTLLLKTHFLDTLANMGTFVSV